jgi:hypothetical protein
MDLDPDSKLDLNLIKIFYEKYALQCHEKTFKSVGVVVGLDPQLFAI